MKFYIAQGKARDKLIELDAKRTAVIKARNKFVGRFKGKGSVSRSHDMVGVVFDGEPPVHWKLSTKFSQNVANTCIPVSTKSGKVLKQEMAMMADPADGWAVANAVELDDVYIFGRPFTIPAFAIYSDKVVVALDDDHEPKHCKRISDVEYERMLKNTKAATKRKRPAS